MYSLYILAEGTAPLALRGPLYASLSDAQGSAVAAFGALSLPIGIFQGGALVDSVDAASYANGPTTNLVWSTQAGTIDTGQAPDAQGDEVGDSDYTLQVNPDGQAIVYVTEQEADDKTPAPAFNRTWMFRAGDDGDFVVATGPDYFLDPPPYDKFVEAQDIDAEIPTLTQYGLPPPPALYYIGRRVYDDGKYYGLSPAANGTNWDWLHYGGRFVVSTPAYSYQPGADGVTPEPAYVHVYPGTDAPDTSDGDTWVPALAGYLDYTSYPTIVGPALRGRLADSTVTVPPDSYYWPYYDLYVYRPSTQLADDTGQDGTYLAGYTLEFHAARRNAEVIGQEFGHNEAAPTSQRHTFDTGAEVAGFPCYPSRLSYQAGTPPLFRFGQTESVPIYPFFDPSPDSQHDSHAPLRALPFPAFPARYIQGDPAHADAILGTGRADAVAPFQDMGAYRTGGGADCLNVTRWVEADMMARTVVVTRKAGVETFYYSQPAYYRACLMPLCTESLAVVCTDVDVMMPALPGNTTDGVPEGETSNFYAYSAHPVDAAYPNPLPVPASGDRALYASVYWQGRPDPNQGQTPELNGPVKFTPGDVSDDQGVQFNFGHPAVRSTLWPPLGDADQPQPDHLRVVYQGPPGAAGYVSYELWDGDPASVRAQDMLSFGTAGNGSFFGGIVDDPGRLQKWEALSRYDVGEYIVGNFGAPVDVPALYYAYQGADPLSVYVHMRKGQHFTWTLWANVPAGGNGGSANWDMPPPFAITEGDMGIPCATAEAGPFYSGYADYTPYNSFNYGDKPAPLVPPAGQPAPALGCAQGLYPERDDQPLDFDLSAAPLPGQHKGLPNFPVNDSHFTATDGTVIFWALDTATWGVPLAGYDTLVTQEVAGVPAPVYLNPVFCNRKTYYLNSDAGFIMVPAPSVAGFLVQSNPNTVDTTNVVPWAFRADGPQPIGTIPLSQGGTVSVFTEPPWKS